MINNEKIIEAIKNRKLVNFNYDNNPIRKASPHALYLTSKGNENIHAYQYEGHSETGNLPDWRTFSLSKIENLEITDENFTVAPGYNTNSDMYDNYIYKI